MNPATPLAPAERFSRILDLLCRAIAARSARRWGVPGPLAAPLALLIWARLRRLAARFTRLAARLEAARLEPAPPPAARRPRSRRPDTPPQPRPPPLPRGHAWLVGLVGYEAAGGASQMQHLLSEPDMAALIAADPRRMGRLLRPLCRMLGIAPPPAIAKPPPPVARTAPPCPAAMTRTPATAPPRRRRAASAPRVQPTACGPPVPVLG